MGTPAQIGKQQYNAVIREARQAQTNLRAVLRRLMSEAPNQMIKALVGNAAIELSEIDSALNQLEHIGQNTRTPTRKGRTGDNRATL